MPSFTKSSETIRSSPRVRFAAAISAINRRRLAGTRGRPGGLDFRRQSSPNPCRVAGGRAARDRAARRRTILIELLLPAGVPRLSAAAFAQTRRELTARSRD